MSGKKKLSFKLPKSRLTSRRLEELFKESSIVERYFFPPAPPPPPQFGAERRGKDGKSHESSMEKN